MHNKLIFSVVLYRHNIFDIAPLLSSIKLLADTVEKLEVRFAVYNATHDFFECSSSLLDEYLTPKVITYYSYGSNIGFGSANNFNFSLTAPSPDELFIVVNPDISFDPQGLLPLLAWIQSHPLCSCVAPLITNPNGQVQFSAKHNPTFFSLLIGRFPSLTCFKFCSDYDIFHRNLFLDYANDLIPCSYLSGCFLIVPSRYFSAVGGFCQNYFLHLEDADLVRRLSLVGETFHNPDGVIHHRWARGSHKSFLQMLHLLRSFVAYSFIWGFRLC